MLQRRLSGGADGAVGWSGRVRRAHGRPYPFSCFMATVLNGAWTSIIRNQDHESLKVFYY